MKDTTLKAIADLEGWISTCGFTRIKRGVLTIGNVDNLQICVSILHREWSDGVCTLYPCLQTYWHPVERAYSKIIGTPYRKLASPSLVYPIPFLPPLNYGMSGHSAVSCRFADWWNLHGTQWLTRFHDPRLVFETGLNALQDGTFSVDAVKVFLMGVALDTERETDEIYREIISRLSRSWEADRFVEKYHTYLEARDDIRM